MALLSRDDALKLLEKDSAKFGGYSVDFKQVVTLFGTDAYREETSGSS